MGMKILKNPQNSPFPLGHVDPRLQVLIREDNRPKSGEMRHFFLSEESRKVWEFSSFNSNVVLLYLIDRGMIY